MKKLLTVIVCAMLMASCVKQASNKLAPIENIDSIGYEKMKYYYEGTDRFSDVAARRSNPNQFYFTCANSWNEDIGNKGLAAEVDVVKFRVGNATMKSYWIAGNAYYINADGDQIRDWSQFGYLVDKGGLLPAYFRYRWNLTKNTGGGVSPPIIVYPVGVNVPLVVGNRMRFEMKNIEGTTWWVFSRNNIEVFRADLEITQMDGMQEACTESWGGSDFSPAIMSYYLDTYKNNQWNHIKTGVSNNTSWGIEGQVQRPDFAKSQFVMGGNTPVLSNNVIPWLWGKP